jgi:hypothetical protein
MLRVSPVASLETYQVFFVDASDGEPRMAVQLEYSRGIFYNQHKICPAALDEVISQALMVRLTKFVPRVGAKAAVVGRVENKLTK